MEGRLNQEVEQKDSSKKKKARHRSEASDPNTFQPKLKILNPQALEENKSTISKEIKSDIEWTDGKRIFVNHIELHDKNEVNPYSITFFDLLHPTLGKTIVTDEKQSIKNAIFSTYVYDQKLIQELIETKIPIAVIKERDSEPQTKLLRDSEYKNLIFAFPQKACGLQYGIFHAKIMLLEFSEFLRVVVTSANLTVVDWTTLSQVVWLQDFPRTKLSLTETERQDFFIQLNDFMTHCFPKNYAYPINLYNYDFTSASASLVTSIAGRYQGKEMSKYGFGRVKEILGGKKLSPESILTYQTSSVGMLKTKYLVDLYHAWTNNKSIKLISKELHKYIEIQFPTKEYIGNTLLGNNTASCVILSKKAYENKEFPKDCLCKLTPIDSHAKDLFHAKVAILATKHEINDDTLIYLGSHNISASAWGKMEKKDTQICISNYEIGIIFAPKKDSKKMKEEIIQSLAFKYPPAKYDEEDTPWVYEEYSAYMNAPD